MKKSMKLIVFINFVVAIGFVLTACPELVERTQIPALTGTVSISGSAQVGQILTANTDSLNGKEAISYQWKRDGIAISGANWPRYTVQSVDINFNITVTVTRTGYSGSVTSDPAGPVGLPQLTGTVSISGTTDIGQNLTANTTGLGGSGTIFYQWKRETLVIGSDSNTYTVQPADAGSTITVTVTRSGYSGSVTSTATVVPPNQNPVASDYSIGNLKQTVGSITAVSIAPKQDKSNGVRTIYYEGTGSTFISIGDAAFYNCTSLVSVTFQGTIASSLFNADAFYELGNLRARFYANNPSNGTPGTYTRAAGSSSWTRQ